MKTYSKRDDECFLRQLRRMEERPEIQRLKENPQHRGNTTFSHCHNVALISYRLARRGHIRVDEGSLIRGAMLHDYYLYDTESMPYSDYRHALEHPKLAARNAEKLFALTEKEEGIIRSHMWPIPGSPLPRSREAWLICLADKICAFREMQLGLRELPAKV